MFTTRRYHKLYKILLVIIILFNVLFFLVTNIYQKKSSSQLPVTHERIDWHDYKMIADDALREGPGENGSELYLSCRLETEANLKGMEVEGVATVVSSKISPNRSLPDFRLEQCQTKKYSKHLPKASIIIVYSDEPVTLMLRCLHSIFNRTPMQLLDEVILVDDKSVTVDSFQLFESYVKAQFSEKLKIFVNKRKDGLAVSRVEAVRRSLGEVIVFMDAHMEVNVNWLPPLLDVIQLNPKAVSVPVINFINPRTFKYEFVGHGLRGGFDWEMVHHWLPKFKEDQQMPEMPFKSPVMSGEILAIRKDFFLELGGYDEGFRYQNAENFELSFKIWLCGGELLQCPCSHVAHVSRNRTKFRSLTYGILPFDFKTRNFKRVVDVWMDEYKQFVYDAVPGRYAIDSGNISKQKKMKKEMNCKPFKYFMQKVAPDVLERYIIDDRGNFASGAIISDADPNLCVTVNRTNVESPLGLMNCSLSKESPTRKQSFALTWHRSIKYRSSGYRCVDLNAVLKPCNFEFGDQTWKYELNTHQIIQPYGSYRCISSDLENKNLFTTNCNSSDVRQKFTWGYTNISALNSWDTFGVKLPQNL